MIQWGQRVVPYLWAMAAVCVGIALRMLLSPYVGRRLPFITLFPALFVAAVFGGLGPTLLATLLSIAAAVFLFLEPQFALQDPPAQIGIALFIVSGLLTGWLGEARLRAARQAAKESERIDRVLGSISDAFLVLGNDWTISYMNDRAAALWGRSRSECVGRSYWEAFPGTTDGPFERAYRRAMADRELVRVEAFEPTVGKWLQVTIYPSPEGLTVVGQDVTVRTEAQEAATRLAAIVSSSEDAIIGKELDGTVISWNAAAERIFGYSAAEMVGRKVHTLIPPELHGTENDALSRVARGEPVEFSEAERIRKDGQRIFINLSVSPIRDASGKVVGASSIKRDITEQMRIRTELATETARSRNLAQALDAAQTLMRDLDGRITYWSYGSARLYGWSAAEAIGRVSHELLHTQFPTTVEAINAALEEKGQWEGELTQTTKDGRTIYVAAYWVLHRSDQGAPRTVIEVNSDATARRQAEQRIRQSERMEVVGQLAGGVAHEANNQMTVVMGAADFLLRRSDLADTVRRDLEQIRGAAERTAAVTAQLLAFSRRQVLQLQILDIDDVVRGLDGVLRRALGERSTLVLQLRGKPGKVRADPGQLAQVLLNLVLNARDAMPLGGRVTIETDRAVLTDQYLKQHPGIGIRPGPYAVLVVSDTGHGMTPDTMRHIFEPFFTTKEVGKGTGLGLATVYGIIKQSGGYVWAYSEAGQGSTLKVYLPVDQSAPVSLTGRATPPPAQGEVILLVEDELAVREMASRALQRHGYGVIEAAEPHQALGLLTRRGGIIHLLVTDVVMPGMDGPELARRACQLRPGLPVLFMSGYTDDEVVRRGLLDSGRPFLQKPFSPEVLVHRVAELLAHRDRSLEPA